MGADVREGVRRSICRYRSPGILYGRRARHDHGEYRGQHPSSGDRARLFVSRFRRGQGRVDAELGNQAKSAPRGALFVCLIALPERDRVGAILIFFSVCFCYYGDMAEQLNSKRATFPTGKQKEFLSESKESLRIAWNELAEICGTSPRNLNDWRNEKISMSFVSVERLCRKRKCAIPKEIVLKDAYWYVTKGARAGGKAVVKKYGVVGGDPEHRKKKWREWWKTEGKLNPQSITQPWPFKKPDFSKELAEFVGILLGDGGISENQVTVSLNRVTDGEYRVFVQRLIRKLFDVPTGLYFDKQSLAERIVISRSALVSYLTSMVGLKQGNKIGQQVDIPAWIKEDRVYSIACVRGLVDTDGCAIIHRYLSKGKAYRYKKVGFTSRSYPLLQSVSGIFSDLGIKHRIMKNGWDIRIEAKEEVEKYFQMVGTHNPKHLERYKSV